MPLRGNPWFTANNASSRRVETPNLSKILLRWCLTVSSLILKYSAISLLEYPATIAETISSSRGVKPNFFCRASSCEDCIRVRRYCTRLETLSRPTQYSPAITVWIAFNNNCVAESLRTTPRAPSCRASTIWPFSAAAVSSMTRTGVELPGALSSRRASNPGCLGIARSSKRMSGFSCRASLTASAPSDASPITLISASASSSRRSPSRKIGWSSAMTKRTCCGFLKFMRHIPVPRHGDLQSSSLTGIRFYREFPGNQTHTFLDDHGAFAGLFNLLLIVTSSEGKTLAIIFECEIPVCLVGGQTDERVPRTAVL